jgi:hypothetical protein
MKCKEKNLIKSTHSYCTHTHTRNPFWLMHGKKDLVVRIFCLHTNSIVRLQFVIILRLEGFENCIKYVQCDYVWTE